MADMLLLNWIPMIIAAMSLFVPFCFLIAGLLVFRYLAKLSDIDRTLKSIEKLLREKKPE